MGHKTVHPPLLSMLELLVLFWREQLACSLLFLKTVDLA